MKALLKSFTMTCLALLLLLTAFPSTYAATVTFTDVSSKILG